MKRKKPCAYSNTMYNDLLHNHIFYPYDSYKIKNEDDYKTMDTYKHPRVRLVLPNSNTHNVIHFRKDYNKVHEIIQSNKRRRLDDVLTPEEDTKYVEYRHNFYVQPGMKYRMVHEQPIEPFRLKPYQQFFINWLYFCENNFDIHPLYKSTYSVESQIRNNQFCYVHPRNGALLAMEMGLGKTIIAFGLVVASLHDQQYFVHQKNGYPTLYLCPKRILHQVETECKRFYPHRLHIKICGKTTLLNSDDIRNSDILVMSYGSFTYMMKSNREVLCDSRWFRVIADESHKLRDSSTLSHQSCNRLAAYRWINMTGTPMFNSITDIINQVRLTGINRLKLSIQTNILKAYHNEKSEQVQQIVNRCLKDRVCIVSKSDVMQVKSLPIERHVVTVPMNDSEQQCYNYLIHYFKTNEKAKRNGVFFFMSLVSMLTDLTSNKKLNFKTHPPPPICYKSKQLLLRSTKYKYLRKIILFCRKKRANSKFIIFDNYKVPLNNAIEYLEYSRTIDNSPESKHKYVFLKSNSHSVFERKVKQFKTDPHTNVMFSTLQLAAEGLNLSMATYMIFLQPWYTDSKMKQGEGRIHRIGQTEKVHIFYLMYKDTIEEVVYNISKQKYKEQELLKDCFRKLIN